LGRTLEETHAELANIFEMIRREHNEEEEPLQRKRPELLSCILYVALFYN
jgi:hypothetical protein